MWTAATATAQVARPTLVGENDQPIDPGIEEDLDDFWHTSVGKFHFSLDELPQHLQLIHEFLKVGRACFKFIFCVILLSCHLKYEVYRFCSVSSCRFYFNYFKVLWSIWHLFNIWRLNFSCHFLVKIWNMKLGYLISGHESASIYQNGCHLLTYGINYLLFA